MQLIVNIYVHVYLHTYIQKGTKPKYPKRQMRSWLPHAYLDISDKASRRPFCNQTGLGEKWQSQAKKAVLPDSLMDQ